MKFIQSTQQIPQDFQGCALTIGNFDGIHLGHQAVLTQLKQTAQALKLPTVVMLFEPQPKEYFMPLKHQLPPARLMRLRDKLYHLNQMGIDYVICIRFDATFVQQTAQTFIQDWLIDTLKVQFLSVGDDFHFGYQRQGNFETLQQAGLHYGFSVENQVSYCIDGERVSSTAIRKSLANDHLESAQRMLGRPYSICGRVVHGSKLGRTIGVPTANILLNRQVKPVQGVYVVKVRHLREPHQKIVKGVANIGSRPTVNGIRQILEVHLFDYQGDLYGKNLEVLFYHKIRPEIKFTSFDELKKQILRDVKTAQDYFMLSA